ncbi:MAG: TRAP transporter small permease subunit [Elioraea sp.]|nr:TRAP transporter small permease subunit [Elioraea sp.]
MSVARAPGFARRLLAAAEEADRAAGLLCRIVVVATGAAMLAVLAANVIARYVLAQGGFRWVQEIPEQLFPWFIAAGAAIAAREGAHISVDLLPRALSEGARRRLLVVVHAIIVVAYGWLGMLALEVAEIAAFQRSTILRLSGSYGYWALAAAAFLIALASVTVALRVAVRGSEHAFAPPSPGHGP